MLDNINNTKEEQMTVQSISEKLNDKKSAKIDNSYVNYQERGHLFEYKLNFNKFLDNITKSFKGE